MHPDMEAANSRLLEGALDVSSLLEWIGLWSPEVLAWMISLQQKAMVFPV